MLNIQYASRLHGIRTISRMRDEIGAIYAP